MPELALDDDQRNALAGYLDGVGVAELMRREPPAYTRPDGGVAQFRAGAPARQTRPRVGPVAMHSSGPTGRSRRAVSQGDDHGPRR